MKEWKRRKIEHGRTGTLHVLYGFGNLTVNRLREKVN